MSVWDRAVRTSGGCLEWGGCRSPDGYGYTFDRATGQRLAHRIAWIRRYGPIPKGMNVCHRCDNPPCIEATHLFLGTQKDNIVDAGDKARMSWGEDRPAAKLTEADVRDIRQFAPLATQAELARTYGVDPSIISTVVNRRSWRHVV